MKITLADCNYYIEKKMDCFYGTQEATNFIVFNGLIKLNLRNKIHKWPGFTTIMLDKFMKETFKRELLIEKI